MVIYAVVERAKEEALTFVQNKPQAKTYIVLYIVAKNKEHYTNWCYLHNRDENLFETKYYYATRVKKEELEDYLVIKQKFNAKTMSKFLRDVLTTKPVGGWWEMDDIQMKAILKKLS